MDRFTIESAALTEDRDNGGAFTVVAQSNRGPLTVVATTDWLRAQRVHQSIQRNLGAADADNPFTATVEEMARASN